MKSKCLVILFFTLLNIVIKGLVLEPLWDWFVVPILNLPPINTPMGIGIVLVFTLLNHLPNYQFENFDEEFRFNILIGVKPFVLLLFGWVLHLLMI